MNPAAFQAGLNWANNAGEQRRANQQSNLALQQFAAQREEEANRLAQTSKAAQTFIKANPEVLTKLGMTDLDFANLSASEKVGVVDGYYKSQAMQDVMQQMAARAAQDQANQQFAGALQSRLRVPMEVPAVGSDPTGLLNFSALPSRTATATRLPERDDLMAAMAAAPMSAPAKDLMSYRLLQDPDANQATRMNAEANLLNARANYGRATGGRQGAGEWTDVPNYSKVPDGKGGFKYLPNRPNAQQSLELSRLKDRRANLLQQVQVLEAQLLAGNKKSGPDWGWGTDYTKQRDAAQQALDEVTARINDLEQGSEGGSAPAKKPDASGSSDLWSEFMNTQK